MIVVGVVINGRSRRYKLDHVQTRSTRLSLSNLDLDRQSIHKDLRLGKF